MSESEAQGAEARRKAREVTREQRQALRVFYGLPVDPEAPVLGSHLLADHFPAETLRRVFDQLDQVELELAVYKLAHEQAIGTGADPRLPLLPPERVIRPGEPPPEDDIEPPDEGMTTW